MKRVAIRAGSLGLHYNHRVNRRSLDYAAGKIAYTSHSRVGAYVRRYRGSRAGSRMTLHHGSLAGIVSLLLRPFRTSVT